MLCSILDGPAKLLVSDLDHRYLTVEKKGEGESIWGEFMLANLFDAMCCQVRYLAENDGRDPLSGMKYIVDLTNAALLDICIDIRSDELETCSWLRCVDEGLTCLDGAMKNFLNDRELTNSFIGEIRDFFNNYILFDLVEKQKQVEYIDAHRIKPACGED